MIAAILIGLLIVVGCGAIVVRLFQTQRLLRAAAASLALGGILVGLPITMLHAVLQESQQPLDLSNVSYATSESCKKCHESEYESWYRTYHRTMTQEASPETVLGDFGDVVVELEGQSCRLFRQGGHCYMELVDREQEQRQAALGSTDPLPRTTYRVDRLVGSHNTQVYLTRNPNNSYLILPLVWHIGEQRWISRGGSFLIPPDAQVWGATGVWNSSCVFCHNTKANPGLVPSSDPHTDPGGRWNTRFAEMGIACEACHGPGQEHIQRNHNPVRRQVLRDSQQADPTIVHPAKLSNERSLELCGRCHGKWVAQRRFAFASMVTTDPHVPGGPPTGWYQYPFLTPQMTFTEEMAGSFFWPDQTPRSAAMEFQGLLLSPCYQSGDMTCLSCHSMHRAAPDDLLKDPEDDHTLRLESNRACLQCHEQYASEAALVQHTHHGAASDGSQCANCHMPFQVYGLLKAIRSHRIASPNARLSTQGRRPNACNQCHVDRSLRWTADWLSRWYGQEPPALTDDDAGLSATVVELLKGHALERALAASRLGWDSAREAAPGNWRVPFLTAALADPYPAVRFLAIQSLRRLAGFENAEYDYLGNDQQRARQVADIRRRWDEVRATIDHPPTESVPLQPDGLPVPEVYQRLLRQRDETPIHIIE